MRLTRFSYTLFTILIHLASFQKRAQHTDARSIKRTGLSGATTNKTFIKTVEEHA
jgi:hypothetical protein